MTEKDFIESVVGFFDPKFFSGVSSAKVFHELRIRDQRQMAACLSLSLDVFKRRVVEGTLPKPEIKVGRRAFYTEEQVCQIKGGALENGEAHLKTSGEHVHKESQCDGPRSRNKRWI